MPHAHDHDHDHDHQAAPQRPGRPDPARGWAGMEQPALSPQEEQFAQALFRHQARQVLRDARRRPSRRLHRHPRNSRRAHNAGGRDRECGQVSNAHYLCTLLHNLGLSFQKARFLQPALTQAFDIDQAWAARSFRKCYEEIARLLTYLRDKE